MKNIRPYFEKWEGTTSEIDAAYQKVTCHIIFDDKILESDGLLRRKARYVAVVHTTETPAALTYASVVSQDSVRIAKANPNVYMRPSVKPNGFEYYEYLICYVNDILRMSHCPDVTMDGIQAHFTLKDDKVEEPTDYLGHNFPK